MYETFYDILEENSSLTHHGIKGMKWGVRRYQNPDGSLTPEGRARYGVGNEKTSFKNKVRLSDDYYALKGKQRRAEKKSAKNEQRQAIANVKGKEKKAAKYGMKMTAANKRAKEFETRARAMEKKYKDLGYGDYVKNYHRNIRRGAELLAGTAAIAGLGMTVGPKIMSLPVTRFMTGQLQLNINGPFSFADLASALQPHPSSDTIELIKLVR